jgi:hypothetical protein
VLERLETCKSGVPTQAGSRSSSMKENTLSTSETERYLMLLEEKMLKDKLLSSMDFIKVPTRDGRLSTLTNKTNNQPQV